MSCFDKAKRRRLARLCNLGIEFYYGVGSSNERKQIDKNHARQLWLQGASEGCADAMNMLAGTSEHPMEGRHWYETAAQQGSAIAMCALGDIHSLAGEWEQANACFLQAAQSGSDSAMYSLAFNIQHGRGGRQGERLAMYWYRRAATRGHTWAIYCLARLLESGSPAEQKASREWLKKGVSLRHKASVMCFALLEAKKGKRGIQWLEMACVMRHVTAISWLVREVEQGRLALRGGVTCCQLRTLIAELSSLPDDLLPEERCFLPSDYWAEITPMIDQQLPAWPLVQNRPLSIHLPLSSCRMKI
ncbi:tetratricopeptide repeat protein [Aeromonas veronii]